MALNHLLNKYAEGGYLKLWFEHSKNGEKLRELRSLINNREELRNVFNKIFEEETNLQI